MIREAETDKRSGIMLNDSKYEFIPTGRMYECHRCALASNGCRMKCLHGDFYEEPGVRYMRVDAACTSLFGHGHFRVKPEREEYALRLDRRRFYMNSMLDGKLYDSVLRALKRIARAKDVEKERRDEE